TSPPRNSNRSQPRTLIRRPFGEVPTHVHSLVPRSPATQLTLSVNCTSGSTLNRVSSAARTAIFPWKRSPQGSGPSVMSKIPSSVKQSRMRSTSWRAKPALSRSITSRLRFSLASMRRPPLAFVGPDQGARRQQHAAHAVDERHPAAGHLAVAALAAELAGGLDDREDPVHPGVGVGEPAAVGVDGQ